VDAKRAEAGDERPAVALPVTQLLQLSIYWFGINAIWGCLDGVVLQERIPALVGVDEGGRALAILKVAAVVIAIVVQPTIGSISDYTMSRWGRRKPYIAIGATLDVVFLAGIATSNAFLAILAFLVLLQFSSNFAQGPFQGYIPDLVPARQVALASALVGIMSVLGVIGGQSLAATGYLLGPKGRPDFTLPTIAVGLIELATAFGTILWVREGRAPRDRAGRTWRAIAGEAWGTDILRQRSYVFLVASRLFVLSGVSVIYNLAVLYMQRSLSLTNDEKLIWVPITGVAVGAMVLLTAIPAARLSNRIGKKSVISLACLSGGAGMAILVVAPTVVVAELGVLLVGLGAGAFLAVDWALMSDIVPKASSGRYMGMSNVATASAGAVALIVGGPLIDLVGGGAGPRAAMVAGLVFFVVGALLLRPVEERPTEDAPEPPSIGLAEPA
jgi:Na+/melibiose symporter-like transporter